TGQLQTPSREARLRPLCEWKRDGGALPRPSGRRRDRLNDAAWRFIGRNRHRVAPSVRVFDVEWKSSPPQAGLKHDFQSIFACPRLQPGAAQMTYAPVMTFAPLSNYFSVRISLPAGSRISIGPQPRSFRSFLSFDQSPTTTTRVLSRERRAAASVLIAAGVTARMPGAILSSASSPS